MEFEEHIRTETPEPDLVPIVDCLVSVIFFLLFSTTFIELTKVTLPPAAFTASASADKTPPLSPKFYVDVKGSALALQLSWSGSSPGAIKKTIARADFKTASAELEDKVNEMASEFIAKHEKEKSIQLALAEDAHYQELITVMDGLRKSIADIVLMSPDEVNRKETN